MTKKTNKFKKATKSSKRTTDPHYRTQWWPEWYDLVIMPKPETGKPPLKIAFLLFPSEAREQLIRLLAPEELDTGEA
jgi:hypothetical protein